MDPHIRLLGNRYELLLPLASGGMGRVWRARDTVLERPVAVKVLRSEFTADATFRARFRAEAQHTAALHHPNIASVFDYGEVQQDGEHLAYLVMELVEGETLADVLAREGRLDAARTLDLLRQASAALGAAHAAGVVHRDIKPGNVLVRGDGTVKITDFGIAWSASSVPLTGTGQVIGTAHYLSPEQAGGGRATPASDVYALGAVGYECLTGRRAFDGESSVQIALKQIREQPAPLPPDVPAELRRLVERAMAKEPAARYPDGSALGAALDAARDGSTVAPLRPVGRTGTAVLPPPPVAVAAPGATATAPARSRRLPLTALLAAFAVLLVLGGVGVLLNDRDELGAPSPSTRSAEAPRTVSLIAADLVGRPVEEVQADLVGRGLRVELAPLVTADVAAGLVTAATPEGELGPRTPVTLTYAVARVPVPEAPDGDPGDGEGEGKGKGKGKDKGNGNGKGDDGGGRDDEDED